MSYYYYKMKTLNVLYLFLVFLPGGGFMLELQPSDRLIVKQSGDQSSFFISCRGVSGLERNVVWRSDKGHISAATADRVHLEPSSTGGIDLVFRWLEPQDQGRYSCSQEGSSKHFDLVVVQSLDFKDTPKIQMVQLGAENYRLKCSISGFPYPTTTWKVKGKNIRNNLGKEDKSAKYVMDGTDLLIRNVEKSDEGRYMCKAVQTVRDTDESESVLFQDFKDFIIDLKIEQSPEWLDTNTGQFYGFVTGRANLTCQAEAQPPPVFSWLDAQNNPVTQGEIYNTEHKSTLVLQVTHHNIFGAYTCIAENIHGRLEKVVMLSEGAKPGTPEIKPNRIFGDSIELAIKKPTADLFLQVEGFQVEIKRADLPWEKAVVHQFKLENTGVYNINGLSLQTFYHVRAKSRNKAGLSDASNIIYLKTNGETSSPLTGAPSNKVSGLHHFSSFAALLATIISALL